MPKNPHAVALGRKGGLVKSEAKRKACQRNGIISAYKRKLAKEAIDKALRAS
jgi:hypothetical protein